jgi:RNA recognition motif-containing protein
MGKNKKCTIFIGSLVSTATESKLQESLSHLKGIGHIKIVRRNDGKLCKGYAFVSIDGGAENFEAALNTPIYYDNRKLEISIAQGGSFKAISMKHQMDHKLHVKSLPKFLNDEELNEAFSRYGELHNAYVIYNPHTHASKRFGYVEFKSKETLEKVLAMPEILIGDRKIIVSKFVHKCFTKTRSGDDLQIDSQSDSMNEQKLVAKSEP